MPPSYSLSAMLPHAGKARPGLGQDTERGGVRIHNTMCGELARRYSLPYITIIQKSKFTFADDYTEDFPKRLERVFSSFACDL